MPADANTPNGPRPPAPIPNVRPAGIPGAIQRAAKLTGASFDYLLATAKVESNLDPNLTMRTSTATGLFQFLEQTWLGVMKTAGRAFGFERYADAITQTGSGRYVVDDPALRDEMMKLRKDPSANAIMGGVFTQQNAAVLARRIGRKPSESELYVAHFFGAYGGARVIQLAASNPDADAAAMFPAAARANRSVFYDRQGNARTVAGVYSELTRRYQVAKARPTPGAAPVVAAPAPAPPAESSRVAQVSVPVRLRPPIVPVPDTQAVASAIAAAETSRQPAAPRQPDAPVDSSGVRAPDRPQPVFHSLFGTEERRGAISPVVAEFWSGPAAARAEAETAPAVERAPGAPLDLFRELRPAGRAVFKGGA